MVKKTREDRVNAASAAMGSGKTSTTARLVGGATSGVLELFFFHPVDVTAKRLMSNTSQRIFVPGDFKASTANFNKIVFREAATASPFNKWTSMFPGLGFAAGYKIMQRTYKFGGQPIVKDKMNAAVGDTMCGLFGQTAGKTITSSLAGSLMGIGEVALLPLDVLKIKAQTNPEALKGRGLVGILREESLVSLYRGAGWTAARNAPGSFALFGGATLVHQGIYKNDGGRGASGTQIVLASVAGSVASITVAAPLDVVKTRIQNKPFGDTSTGGQIIRNLIRQEGMGAFFKGLGPKLAIVSPKLMFSMSVAQYTMNFVAGMID